jgi:L-asparaginase II
MKTDSANYRVEVRRGKGHELEANHIVTVFASDGADTPRLSPEMAANDWVTCFRSGCKPFQALPLVERGHADRFGFGEAELAVMCASHNGAREHIEVVRGILVRIGLREETLECGFHFPYDEASTDQVRCGDSKLSPIFNNCSGKHAGMLALAVAEGWPVKGYVQFDHQARESDSSPRQKALARLANAMAAHPVLVAGEGRLCTALMRAGEGEVVAKTGAEGLQCVAVPAAGVGIAAKVHDGANRAKGPAIIDFMAINGWLTPRALEQLSEWRRPVLKNHRGIEVGTIELEAERVLPGHP